MKLFGAVTTLALSLGACFVPQDEATLTFNYLLLHENAAGIGAFLCAKENVEDLNPDPSFNNTVVSTLVVTGRSARGLVVRREATCVYAPEDAQLDSLDEVGFLSVEMPADVYDELTLQLEDAEGNPVTWNTEGQNGANLQEINLLGNAVITLQARETLDLGDLFVAQDINGAVDKELKIFIQEDRFLDL